MVEKNARGTVSTEHNVICHHAKVPSIINSLHNIQLEEKNIIEYSMNTTNTK